MIKVEIGAVLKLRIVKTGLDPIDVMIHNETSHGGWITIRYWDKAWTGQWGNCGQVDRFFVKCDNSYLLAHMTPRFEMTRANRKELTSHMSMILDVVREGIQQYLDEMDQIGRDMDQIEKLQEEACRT